LTTALAIYGALLSTALGAGSLFAWLSANKRLLGVRLFISPLVVDGEGHARVQNDQGHPVIQEGAAREFLVVRAHNTGKRPVQVARVEFVDAHTGRAENLSWLLMPKTIPPDEVQLWYSKVVVDPKDDVPRYPKDILARVVLTDGKTFVSPRYSSLLGYLNPLDPIAGRGVYS
jgi:hypothetical protein